jgi:hypothetical protein
MARTALPVTPRLANDSIARPTGTAGNADGHYVDTNTRTTINDDTKLEQLTLQVTVATATTTVTVKAGDYPPALDASQGDLVRALTVGEHEIGPFNSGRFLQSDGRIHIDYSAAGNVTVRAYRHPRYV